MRKSILVFLIVSASALAQSKKPVQPVTVPKVSTTVPEKSIVVSNIDLRLARAARSLESAQSKLKQLSIDWFSAQATAETKKKEAESAAPAANQAVLDAAKAFDAVVEEAYKEKGYTKDKWDFDREKLEFVEKKAAAKEVKK